MEVVVERHAMFLHGVVEGFFACMPEGRMADVMDQCERFYEVGVQIQCGSDSAGDLRDFQRVRESVTKVVGITARENLRLGFKTAKGARVNDAVAIALKIVSIGMWRLGKSAPARLLDVHGVISEHGASLAEIETSSARV
jgi:hypothetical protein